MYVLSFKSDPSLTRNAHEKRKDNAWGRSAANPEKRGAYYSEPVTTNTPCVRQVVASPFFRTASVLCSHHRPREVHCVAKARVLFGRRN
jgi:hypothetical protein